ncbi:isopeptide-forming domain-containing fimbrial protein [Bifidobacterium moukalabense]|uniref:isopeptide-forming domain-containing fimbrial protein n=1 Tax=Bifidobacterium moukalabense TaxID=1333651 RepID=UPI0010F849CC|nr:isopeptide-forming domain-containing fimbrial protein [Bifidobacterium moukalabense]
MKKAINALVAVLATVAMAVAGFMGAGTAFADETTYNLTVNGTGHTYEIYQIFTGTPSGGKLTDVKWGKNGTGTAGTAVDDATLTAVSAVTGTDQAKADALKGYADLTGDAFTTVAGGTAAPVPAGYYLVKDQEPTDGTKLDSYTTYIVKVVDQDVTATPKSDVPSFEKKIKDTNDTTGDTSDWQDSADYDMGDAVPFKLEGTVASNYDSYKTYYFAFHDVEEKGLTFNKDSVKVSVDGTVIDSGYTVVTEGLTDGCTFEVKFADLKTIDAVKAGSKISVEYTSTLNESAKIGEQGNVNKAKLQYSNNPNAEQGGESGPTGETPWDNVIVFTYKTVINKVDDKNQPLKGAEFTLSKKFADGSTKTVAVVKNDEGTTFTFNGLDDGDYVLSETKNPDGYNKIDDITFTVNAEHSIEWDGTGRTSVLTSLSGDKKSGSAEFTMTADKAAGSLTSNVVNKPGSTLPETGGMGTIVLYVAGAALVIAAGVYFALRKRNAR